jgi:hypothetical protein
MISPMTQIWNNWGIIRRISSDRTRITIGLPKGGSIDAPNAGFSLGECVAFTINQLTNEVVSVLPREVAEVKRLLASQPLLELAVSVAPEPRIEESGIPREITTEEILEVLDEYCTNDDSKRQETSDSADLCGGESGELIEDWEDLSGYTSETEELGLGFEDRLYDNLSEEW